MLKVKLLAYTEDPEKVVAMAAKLCYSSTDITALEGGMTPEKNKNFLEMLTAMGHQSPIEHVGFTFAIEGVSRSLTHQLVRHRIASFSQKSQRYVAEGQFDYIIPPHIAKRMETKTVFIQTMEKIQQAYDHLVDELKKKGRTEKEALEDARYVLPNACETKIMATFNARSLYNFFAHRCCNRAQWEIRELAEQMYRLVLAVAPTLFSHAGPACLFGPCPEGKMSCGQASLVKEKFKK